VFAAQPFGGNPVAVVLDAAGLDGDAMQRVASWTNLSETTFVGPPTQPRASYSVRIFTPTLELPFAGHPTLGTAHAWLEHTGRPDLDEVVQECGAGLVRVRRTADGLAFEAPPLVREGPVAPELVERLARILGIGRDAIRDTAWVDNGPGWVGVLLEDAEAVLAVEPGWVEGLDIGIVGPHAPGAAGDAAWEVRAFFAKDGVTVEDPVTGSLNASLARWLTQEGRATLPYVARQGTALGRSGRVVLSGGAPGEGDEIWVAGATTTRVRGTVTL
jgi:PhzF family phenazine biosynthesis protein